MKSKRLWRICLCSALLVHGLFLFMPLWEERPLAFMGVYLANIPTPSLRVSHAHWADIKRTIVMPAKAGIQGHESQIWMPASAGMTGVLNNHTKAGQGGFHPSHLLYLEYWKKKVEKVGRFNYPPKASLLDKNITVDLLVTLGRDGSVKAIDFLKRSKDETIDHAILNSVLLAAPFLPPPPGMQQKSLDGIEIVSHFALEQTTLNTHVELTDARAKRPS